MAVSVALADECLGRLFAALTAVPRAPLDLAVTEWLLQGLLTAARQGVPLEEALGLAGGGRRTFRQRLLQRQRDEHLVRALQAVAADARLPLWPRCLRLAPEVKRFLAVAWPRARRLGAAPSEWPAYRQALFGAAATGLALPTSASGLRDACQRVAPYSLTRQPGSIRLIDFL
jgi:hypothetical protein